MIGGSRLRRLALQALSPLEMDQVGPDSVDVRLSNKWFKQRTLIPQFRDFVVLSVHDESQDPLFEAGEGEIILPSKGFIKAYMFEYVTMPEGITAMFSLRSRWAQKGLQQAVSVWIRQGWKGELVLELTNDLDRPMILTPGMFIGQLHFFEVKNQ